MRKADKEIRDQSVIVGLLRSCHVGRLATKGRDGWPTVKTMNFANENERIYIHSAFEGEKIDEIKGDGRVCLETDLPIAFVRARTQPCEAEYFLPQRDREGQGVRSSCRPPWTPCCATATRRKRAGLEGHADHAEARPQGPQEGLCRQGVRQRRRPWLN
jgi:hypothetical protein